MRLHHIAITVVSLEETITFYTEKFGFIFYKSFSREDMGARATMLRLGEIILELWEFDNSSESADDLSDIRIRGIRHIAFAVEKLDEIVDVLREKGCEVSDPVLGASNHRYSFTKDPNGVALELYEL